MSNKPTHLVYHVRDNGDSDKSFWTRVGAAWKHQDGKGFNVTLDAVPLDGRLVLREASEKDTPAS
jgi:hypothetical protein